ncbi:MULTISPECIES: GlcG/HbpS family heme-binding protein [unclassified Cupriavidus]|uniref:GlcG/HbpS family heme-binding protein n=1 Tax=unclassified Cupriavidus TaxID=2640874 RepID=UPI0009F24A66|nr:MULTISPECIES: heme-binding protein [unclassified Cupriavidus]
MTLSKALASLVLSACFGAAASASAQPAAPAGTVPAAHISLDQAQALIQAAVAYAKSLQTGISIVVVDASGHVVAAARMSGVPFGSFDVARGKALASVATGGVSGRELMERYRANPIVFGQISALSYGGPMFPSQGSLPIFFGDTLVGAAGASAASSQTDEDAVRAGIRAIGALAERGGR